ncbi:MAG: response regulator, partial [Cyclobacteriaceae bacterium]|nr:response regulator [Cyclobacteriaceae bacterium]
LVELMGGRISVESTEGKGSEFAVEIPINWYGEEKKRKEDILENKKLNFGKATLLVVDDVKYNRLLIKAYFKKTQVDVLMAESGREGIDLAIKHKPDLILMDLQMPEMDGDMACRELRNNPITKEIPVIAFTASITSDRGYMKSGLFDDVLIKPVSEEDIDQVLSNFLRLNDNSLSQQQKTLGEANGMNSLEIEKAIQYINDNFKERIRTLSEAVEIGQMEVLLHDLNEYMKFSNSEILMEYYLNLKSAYSDFDINLLTKLLKEFPVLVEDIQKQFQTKD